MKTFHLERELKTRPEVDQGPAGVEVDVVSVVHAILVRLQVAPSDKISKKMTNI